MRYSYIVVSFYISTVGYATTTYTVNSNGDGNVATTFRYAINQINAAGGADTFVINVSGIAGQTITLTSDLPVCIPPNGSTIQVTGSGTAVTISGASGGIPAYRNTLFRANTTIDSLSLSQTLALGGTGGSSDFGGGGGGGAGMGGGWFVYPSTTLTVTGGTISSTKATGGNGGNSDYTGVDADGGSGAGGGSFCSASRTGNSATADDNGAAGGGDGGGTGGAAGNPPTSGGAGTQLGGGGGGGGFATTSANPGAIGGAGAFGGGGGGAGNTSGLGVTLAGGAGGYGAGGGGIGEGNTGTPIPNGGAGGTYGGNGGGGAYIADFGCAGGGGGGIGGLAFVADSATLVLSGVSSWSNGTVAGGAAGISGVGAPAAFAGQGVVPGVFLYQSAQLQFQGTCTIGFNIDSDAALATPDSGIKINSGTTTISSVGNTYRGATTLAGGTLNVSADSTLGTGTSIAVTGSATLQLGNTISSMARTVTITSGQTFTVDTNSFNLTNTGAINGSGGLLAKIGTGTLTLSNSGGTYSGGTTITAGTVAVSAAALGSGSIAIGASGTLQGTASFTLSNAATVATGSTISVPTLAHTLVMSGAITGSGSLTKTGSGALTLSSGSTAYTGATSISAGTLALSGSGTIASSSSVAVDTTFDISQVSGASSTIQALSGAGTISLGSKNLQIASGSFSGAIGDGGIGGGTGGSLTKTGSGTLILTGTNSYTGNITINGGTLQGNTSALLNNIANNATLIFSQSTAGTYAGQITGGAVTVDGGGLVTMSAATSSITSLSFGTNGQLALNGSLNVTSIADITVPANAKLQGTGTLTAPATIRVYGTLHPGNSIGTITINGNYVQQSGSTFSVDLNPTATGLLSVSGSVTIQSGAALLINPEAGVYTPGTIFTIIQSTGSLRTGEFSTVTLSLPAFRATPIYANNTNVQLLIDSIPLPDLPISADARIAARCVQSAIDSNANSSLLDIYEALQLMQISQMNRSLTSMLPTALNLLDFAQNTALLQTRQTLSREMNFYLKKRCGELRSIRLWSDVFFNHSRLKTQEDKVGCSADINGGTVGLDVQIGEDAFVGAALGYSDNPVRYSDSRGSARIYDSLAMLYAGGFFSPSWYLQTALIGSFNYYDSLRKMFFDGLNVSFTETAKGRTKGASGLTHLELGMVIDLPIRLRPFTQLDWTLLHRSSFEEYGATGANLIVSSHTSDLLRSETGIEISACITTTTQNTRFEPYAIVAGISQHRLFGETETATFQAIQCPMTVKGHSLPKGLFFFETGLLTKFYYDHVSLSADYSQEMGHDYANHTWSFQARCNF